MTMIIPIDLGNSGAKTRQGNAEFFIDGAVSVDRKAIVNGNILDASHSRKPIDNIRIIRNNVVYKVGKLATLDDDYRAPVGMNRYLEDDYIDLILQAAFVVTKASGNVNIVVGLPVDGYTDKNKAMVKEKFIGRHTVKRPGRKDDIVVNVKDVVVQPEPLGTYFGQLLDTKSNKVADPLLSKSKVGIIDIGEFTADLLVMDNGKYVRGQSKSLEYASNKVLQLFSDNVFDAIQYRIPDSKLKDVFNHPASVVLGTGQHDLTECAINALDETGALLVSSVSRVWTDAEDMYKIFICGGAAPKFKTAIQARYSQAVLVRNSRFSNVNGFYSWGVAKWQKK